MVLAGHDKKGFGQSITSLFVLIRAIGTGPDGSVEGFRMRLIPSWAGANDIEVNDLLGSVRDLLVIQVHDIHLDIAESGDPVEAYGCTLTKSDKRGQQRDVHMCHGIKNLMTDESQNRLFSDDARNTLVFWQCYNLP